MDNSRSPNQTNDPPVNTPPLDSSSLWTQSPNPTPDPTPSSNPWSSIPTTPSPEPAPITSTQPQTTSPLDNPWGAPSQPPALDGGLPPSTAPLSQSQYQVQSEPPQPEPVSSIPSWTPPSPSMESTAPTDLSHLIGGTPVSTPEPETAQVAPSETLVVPPANPVADTPTLPTENHKSIPKWLIGVGVGLLIVVMGASAYFILGVGQPAKPESLPATESQTNEVVPIVPVTTPTPQPVEETSESTNFGALEGSATAPQATSAADLIRQRQQQGQ